MNESNLGGLSIRGIIAFVVIVSLCGICIYLHTAESLSILKDTALVIITFYFSQKSTQTSGGTNEQKTTIPATDISGGKPANIG